MSCINVSGTKVVRAGKDLSEDAFLSDVQNKTVQSIMGATEKRLDADFSLNARFSGLGANICWALIYYGYHGFCLLLQRCGKPMDTIITRKLRGGSTAYTA
jgi:hypothetical protein